MPPRIYEGGGPRSGRGSFPAAAAGKASSVTAAPCQLPQRGSRGRFAPFLPPAFMRGEGHAVAGGVLRRSGKASSVTAAPCQLPQRGSRGRFAPFLPPAFMRGEGHAVAGGVLRRSGDGPLSHASRASSPRGEAEGASPRSCPPHKCGGQGLWFRSTFHPGDFYASDFGHRLGMGENRNDTASCLY